MKGEDFGGRTEAADGLVRRIDSSRKWKASKTRMDNVEFLLHISYEEAPELASAEDLIRAARYDGQPLTSEQLDQFGSCSREDFRSAVVLLEVQARYSSQDVQLAEAATRLIQGTPEANNLKEMGRIRDADPGDLLAEESGLDSGTVRLHTQL